MASIYAAVAWHTLAARLEEQSELKMGGVARAEINVAIGAGNRLENVALTPDQLS